MRSSGASAHWRAPKLRPRQSDRRGILLGYVLARATSHAGQRCQLADVRERHRTRDRRSALGPRCRLKLNR